MEFINKSYNNLVSHLITNGIDLKKSDFEFLNSIDEKPSKKVGISFFNLFIDRKNTPKTKIIRKKSSYQKVQNHFELLFVIEVLDLDKYAVISKILVDFEDFLDDGKIKLLNSIQDFNTYNLFNLMKQRQRVTPFLVAKISIKEITLQELPKLNKKPEEVVFSNVNDKDNKNNKSKIYHK